MRDMDFDDEPSSRTRRLGLVTLISVGSLALIGVGMGLGRLIPSAAEATPATASRLPIVGGATARPSDLGAAIHVVAGVEEGFARSDAGALQAGAAFERVEGGDLLARPDVYRAAWKEMCTPEYWSSAGRDAAETVLTTEEQTNHLLSNAAAGQLVFEHVFPLTGAVTRTADDTATVRIWSLVVAHPGDGPTVVSFAAGTLDLRWVGGDWKLAGGKASTSTSDGASGLMRLDAGPFLPGFLAQQLEVRDAPPTR